MSNNPDRDWYFFSRGLGEFSLNSDIAFNKHLEYLATKMLKCKRYSDFVTQEPFWYTIKIYQVDTRVKDKTVANTVKLVNCK